MSATTHRSINIIIFKWPGDTYMYYPQNFSDKIQKVHILLNSYWDKVVVYLFTNTNIVICIV